MARGEFVDSREARPTQQSHLTPSSLYVIESAWRLWVEPRWGTTAVADVRCSDVRAWVTEMAELRSATSVIRAYGILAAILDVAVRDRRILSNPLAG